jgi:ATP-dependent Zn protease
MSGADLANLLNEGAIVAARQNKAEIDADDIANALDDGWMGKTGNRIENLGYVTHMLHV